MSVTAVIRIPCESNPSLGTTVVNGLLAWAGVLGGATVFFLLPLRLVCNMKPSLQASLKRAI